MVESGSDDTAVSVGSSNLAPDHSNLAASPLFRGSVDECDALAQVESEREYLLANPSNPLPTIPRVCRQVVLEPSRLPVR